MRVVIRYVSQDAKTLDENGYRYLSGINCIGDAAYDEFMATKNSMPSVTVASLPPIRSANIIWMVST